MHVHSLVFTDCGSPSECLGSKEWGLCLLGVMTKKNLNFMLCFATFHLEVAIYL